MITNLITTLVGGFLLHLLIVDNKQRKKSLNNLSMSILYLGKILDSKTAKFTMRTAVYLLIIGSAVFGALTFTIGILNNKPVWLCLLAPVLSVGGVLPLSLLVYKQFME